MNVNASGRTERVLENSCPIPENMTGSLLPDEVILQNSTSCDKCLNSQPFDPFRMCLCAMACLIVFESGVVTFEVWQFSPTVEDLLYIFASGVI